jgi:hypothetical protein
VWRFSDSPHSLCGSISTIKVDYFAEVFIKVD